jgi:1-acyl-sn-glycerol-3-phosphate acyltransferase
VLIVAAPHRHWLDGFVLEQALPARLRRRLLVVTNRDFQPLFEPAQDTTRLERARLAFVYWVILPSLFPFTVVPSFGRTREGLIETARKVGQGFHPITFPEGLRYYGMTERDRTRHDPGAAWLAIETGAPLLPAVLVDNEEMGWQWRRPRRTVEVRFGEPLWPRPGEDPEALSHRVRDALTALGREVEED